MWKQIYAPKCKRRQPLRLCLALPFFTITRYSELVFGYRILESPNHGTLEPTGHVDGGITSGLFNWLWSGLPRMSRIRLSGSADSALAQALKIAELDLMLNGVRRDCGTSFVCVFSL